MTAKKKKRPSKKIIKLSEALNKELEKELPPEPPPVFAPGIHTCAYERYKAASGVSKSMLDWLEELTPAHLRQHLDHPKRSTPAQRFGIILHRAFLEPDTYRGGFHVKPKGMKFNEKSGMDWLKEHKDRPIVTFDEEKTITAMVSALYTHSYAKRLLLNGHTEATLFVEHDGILRKSRLDSLTAGDVVPDVKTAACLSEEAFSKSISKYRYHVQGAFYVDNCKLLGMDKKYFMLIGVEKEPPYGVRCFRVTPQAMAWGRICYQNNLQVWADCINNNRWPAWDDPDGYIDAELPPYEMKQIINAPLATDKYE